MEQETSPGLIPRGADRPFKPCGRGPPFARTSSLESLLASLVAHDRLVPGIVFFLEGTPFRLGIRYPLTWWIRAPIATNLALEGKHITHMARLHSGPAIRATVLQTSTGRKLTNGPVVRQRSFAGGIVRESFGYHSGLIS